MTNYKQSYQKHEHLCKHLLSVYFDFFSLVHVPSNSMQVGGVYDLYGILPPGGDPDELNIRSRADVVSTFLTGSVLIRKLMQ